MPQQQQSNMVKPQMVGGVKKGMKSIGKMYPKMDKIYKSGGPKISKKGTSMDGMDSMKTASKQMDKMPSLSKVQKSVRKTMGY